VVQSLAEHTGEGCSVDIIHWHEYKEAMLGKLPEKWKILWNADLVIGGLELDSDFMQVPWLFIIK
jgi:hypothetical protein